MISKFHEYAAPKRFVFEDPDTGHYYQAPSRAELIAQIVNYRRQNRLEKIDYLDVVVDNYLCTLPENAGACTPVKLDRGIFAFTQGAVALVKNVFYKKQTTDEEAERRAKICLRCPYNVFLDKGAFNSWADSLAEAMTGGRKVSVNDKLGNCEVCSCNLRGKVFYGGKVLLKKAWKEKMQAVSCWQLEIEGTPDE